MYIVFNIYDSILLIVLGVIMFSQSTSAYVKFIQGD